MKELYKDWFKTGFLTHYKKGGELPVKHNLSFMHSKETPVVVYGHFNKLRNFGIESYYPDVEQFIEICQKVVDEA